MTDSSRERNRRPARINSVMRDRSRTRNQSDLKFSQMLEHARHLSRIDRKLSSILDPALASHCQVAEFRDHGLILVCSNASFATRIRMITSQILESLAEEGESGIEQIFIRIAPVNQPKTEVRKERTMSSTAIEALGRFAADSDDEEIQAIFDRMKSRRNRQ